MGPLILTEEKAMPESKLYQSPTNQNLAPAPSTTSVNNSIRLPRQAFLLGALAAVLIMPGSALASSHVIESAKNSANFDGLTVRVEDDPATTGVLKEPDPTAAAAIKSASPDQQQAMIKGMVDNLRAKLEKNPNNLNGWQLLAKSYRVMGQNDKADAVEKKVKDLEAKGVIKPETTPVAAPTTSEPSAPTIENSSKSSLIHIPPPPALMGGKSSATPAETAKAPDDHEAEKMDAMVEGLRAKLEKNPNNFGGWVLLSNSYRALGKIDKANATDAKIRELKAKGILKEPPPSAAATAPAGAPASAAVPMTPVNPISSAQPDQQNIMYQDMIDGLTAKLKKNPKDGDGWERLSKYYQTVGQTDKAKAAEAKAIALKAKTSDEEDE